MRNLRRWLQRLYVKLVRTNDVPEKIAMGMAVGVFLGIFPTFGFGLILALFLATIFKLNKLAAILGTGTGVPWLAPFIWVASYRIGAFLLGYRWRQILLNLPRSRSQFVPYILKNVKPYLVGNFILSLTLAIAAYFLTLKAVIAYQRMKAERRRGRRKRSVIIDDG